MDRKRKITWIVLIIVAVGIKIFSFFPTVVENYYSSGIYPVISRAQRILLGWIPFSLGDIFYAIIFIWILAKLISFLRKLFWRRLTRAYFLYAVRRIIFLCLWIYILFNLTWGLNYNRLGIAYQLQLDVKTYSTAELSGMLQMIVDRLNETDSLAHIKRPELSNKHFLFSEAITSYHDLEKQNNFFVYRSPSVKPSIFSYAGNYLGFTGYYNPFSGEAQVNTTVPMSIEPFTTCHEMGHQLGYAKENEANFSGYLAAKSSDNIAFRYSVYFDMYIYAARGLYVRDSNLVKKYRDQLHPSVRNDYKELREFFKKYQNPIDPFISKLYGRYLKANQQPQGMMSYDEVIAWLIAYSKKYGKEAI
ncbi:MAG TPA: DUF3810 domain-containing protein [Puia sp.]|jgi:hypothetical protein|nr:DUF3810 domain-containing protein [Puia sp.]